MKFLAKNTTIDNPESVKQFIANQETWSIAYKEGVVNAYVHYVKVYSLDWIKPKYKRSERLLNVPTTEQVNKIIADSGKKYCMIFSILRDTGLRPIELQSVNSS
ncbi:MAG: hypothetical protein IAX21_08780 [Candidatus Bathyarchaeota archaeon]|nr:MAG: hypothetical protein IAX21_08780 [Candidatus Bathyarchaeota archaeon]